MPHWYHSQVVCICPNLVSAGPWDQWIPGPLLRRFSRTIYKLNDYCPWATSLTLHRLRPRLFATFRICSGTRRKFWDAKWLSNRLCILPIFCPFWMRARLTFWGLCPRLDCFRLSYIPLASTYLHPTLFLRKLILCQWLRICCEKHPPFFVFLVRFCLVCRFMTLVVYSAFLMLPVLLGSCRSHSESYPYFNY